MAASVTEEQWDAGRGSVRTTMERYCELVTSIPDPGTKVTAEMTAAQSRDPAETFPWLGGARVPLAGMFAHMVNEMLIHGNDIAHAVKAQT